MKEPPGSDQESTPPGDVSERFAGLTPRERSRLIFQGIDRMRNLHFAVGDLIGMITGQWMAHSNRLTNRSLELFRENKIHDDRTTAALENEADPGEWFWLFWATTFQRTLQQMSESHPERRLTADDCAYRTLVVNDRLADFCDRYLHEEGWNHGLRDAVSIYQVAQVRLGLETPSGEPLPEVAEDLIKTEGA